MLLTHKSLSTFRVSVTLFWSTSWSKAGVTNLIIKNEISPPGVPYLFFVRPLKGCSKSGEIWNQEPRFLRPVYFDSLGSTVNSCRAFCVNKSPSKACKASATSWLKAPQVYLLMWYFKNCMYPRKEIRYVVFSTKTARFTNCCVSECYVTYMCIFITLSCCSE